MVKKYKIISERIGYFSRKVSPFVIVCYFGFFLSFTFIIHFLLDRKLPKMGTEKPMFFVSESGKRKIMIISSMPRSGSTLIGEIITGYSETLKYYFEPDQYLEKNKCLTNDSCTVNFFNDLFLCREDIEFHNWFRKKQMFFNYYNDIAKNCSKRGHYADCAKKIDLINDCKETDVQLVKNIRTPLRVVEPLLNMHSDLKVIHLVRDPRGALNSIHQFHWQVTEETRCNVLLEDLNVFEKLKETFPNRILKISYEIFSSKPIEETKKLFKFLFGLDEIPEKIMKNIKRHVSPEKNISGVMSTVKNSTNQYQSWRWKISKSYLEKVENIQDCRESILKMKHNLFGTISNTQNKTFSLFFVENL